MKIIKINARRALNALRDVQRGRGYKYLDHHESCTYSEYDPVQKRRVGSCIVGRAVEHIYPGVKWTVSGCFHVVIQQFLAENPELEFTPGAIAMFQAAQGAQDNGTTDEQAYQVAVRLWYLFSRIDEEKEEL